MTTHNCEYIQQILIDYADNELSVSDKHTVAEHLRDCCICSDLLESLNTSLDMAQIIWQEELDQAEYTDVSEYKSKSFNLRIITGIAAGVLMTAGLFYFLHGNNSVFNSQEISDRTLSTTSTIQKAPLVLRQIELEVLHAENAARLLAIADMHAKTPGGISTAIKRYKRLKKQYPLSEPAIIAVKRMKHLLERSTIQ